MSSWRLRALCAGPDGDGLDWDSSGNSGSPTAAEVANAAACLAVCDRCPVKAPCLADVKRYEHTRRSVHGIRGGQTAAQRRKALGR